MQPSIFHMNKVTDVHLRGTVADVRESIAYPGPRRITEDEASICVQLIERCIALQQRDFMFKHEGVHFRGHTDDLSVDGRWYRLKLLRSSPPSLDELPTPLPASVVKTLMSERFKRGGLVLVSGPPGAGKTHTGSAVVVSRLKHFGGVAYTLEDPPEMPLSGWHGEEGVCHQGQVPDDDKEGGWADAFRGILRSQPAGSTPILFVGELRDGGAVRASIRAAQNGFLVIATSFGTELTEGITSTAMLAADGQESQLSGVYEALGTVLKVVVHQQLRKGKISATILAIPEDSSQSAMIRKGHVHSLRGQVDYQQNIMFANQPEAVDLMAPQD